MFINKTSSGENNLIGRLLSEKRKKKGFSQRGLADRLQVIGLDVDKNAIQRIECGKRFVMDIELVFICKALGVDPNEMLQWNSK